MKRHLLIACSILLTSLGWAHIPESYMTWEIVSNTEDASLNGFVRISGIVYEGHSDDYPLGGVNVGNRKNHSSKSNEKGFYQMDSIKPGTYRVRAASPGYEVAQTTEVKIKANHHLVVNFHMMGLMEEVEKPVIYLYPAEDMDVEISLDFTGRFGLVYPAFNGEGATWRVVAKADGGLSCDGSEFDYLFYDGQLSRDLFAGSNLKQGFVVSKEGTVGFLEEKLTAIGLNAREKEDFITYWAPRMIKHKYNFVHFRIGEAYNNVAGISVSPEPDHMIRVFMLFQPLDKVPLNSPEPQNFHTAQRDGFTLVEWGGTEIAKKPL